MRSGLGEAAAGWPLVVADSADQVALSALARRTRVVASAVGPYARHGLPLVRACAEAGTHYADLTGETLFVRESIDQCHATARASGARVVHACGFDSVPSDLAALLLHDRAAADAAGGLTDTTLVARLRGGVGGTTVDSMRVQFDAMQADIAARRILLDPYALSPDRSREPQLGDERDEVRVRREDRLGGWVGPFVMGAFNARVVRRSNALQDWAYGRGFRYRELMGFGRGAAAPAIAGLATLGLGALVGGLGSRFTRPLLDRVLPEPGQGPSEQARAAGFFRMRVYSTTTTGAQYVATVAAQGDPGYAATAVMLGESALALAAGVDLPDRAGVLTPATGIGLPLVDRLRDAGFELAVERL